jgi:hypothetical protein
MRLTASENDMRRARTKVDLTRASAVYNAMDQLRDDLRSIGLMFARSEQSATE